MEYATVLKKLHQLPIVSKLSRRRISNYTESRWRKFLDIALYRYRRRKLAETIANQFHPERILMMGPDFACIEWLMNAGATSVQLSDGTMLTTQMQMREFLKQNGFDVRGDLKEAPDAQILKDFHSGKQFRSSLLNDTAYNERWHHISPVHIKEVDASDAVVTDRGFKYFLECRNIEKLLLNFNDYFGDDALKELSQGRPVRSLKHLEICFNPFVSDRCAFILNQFQALQRLHMYFLPCVVKRTAVLRQLKTTMPRCNVTFPELYFIGMGYETETEKLAYEKFMKTNATPLQRWLNSKDPIPEMFARLLRRGGKNG